MIFKRTLGLIALAGTLALAGCSELEPEYRNISGRVCQLDQQELIYVDSAGLGSSNNIPVPITFLGVEAEDREYQMILAGPHNLQPEDFVELDYLVDTEVTGTDIWQRAYPKRRNCIHIHGPNVKFKTDGYVTAWKKE
jgi:hypothetical protein